MDLRIFDQELEPLGLVDEMDTCIWYVRYWKPGEFKILAPMTDNNMELLACGNIVIKHDEYTDYEDADGNVWRRAGEITQIEYTRDVYGAEQIEAKGYFLAKWLWKRIVYPQVTYSGTRQEVVNYLISQNLGEDADEDRQFPQFETLDQEDLGTGDTDFSSAVLETVGEEVQDICQASKIGFDILACERTKTYGFYLYKGDDLTSDNSDGNTPCVFSRDFDNVNEQEYTHSTESYRNRAYVYGVEDEDTGNRYVTTVDKEGLTGLDLYETAVSASSISRYEEDDDGNRTELEDDVYYGYLAAEGEEELDEDVESYTFESEINLLSNLTYMEDYKVGDRITCVDKAWNLTIDSRITEVTQTYNQKGVTFEATFGESTPTLLEAIQKTYIKA